MGVIVSSVDAGISRARPPEKDPVFITRARLTRRGKNIILFLSARVAELADALDLGCVLSLFRHFLLGATIRRKPFSPKALCIVSV